MKRCGGGAGGDARACDIGALAPRAAARRREQAGDEAALLSPDAAPFAVEAEIAEARLITLHECAPMPYRRLACRAALITRALLLLRCYALSLSDARTKALRYMRFEQRPDYMDTIFSAASACFRRQLIAALATPRRCYLPRRHRRCRRCRCRDTPPPLHAAKYFRRLRSYYALRCFAFSPITLSLFTFADTVYIAGGT